LPRNRADKTLITQLRQLEKPAKVMLITANEERNNHTKIDDICLVAYTRQDIQNMGERGFTALTKRHDCILLSPLLGDGDFFLKSLREALNKQLGGVGVRLILHEIEETTPNPQINQRLLWENLKKTLGRGSDQLREATMRRLRLALDEENMKS